MNLFNEPEPRTPKAPKKPRSNPVVNVEDNAPCETMDRTLADEFEDQIENLYSLPQVRYPRNEIKFSPSQLAQCNRAIFYANSNAKADPHEPQVGWRSRIPRNGEGVHECCQKDLRVMHKKLTDNNFPCRFKMVETEKVLRRTFNVDGAKVTLSGRCDGILVDTETGQMIVWEYKTKDKLSNLTKIKDPSCYILQCIAYAAVLDIYDVIIHIETLQKPSWGRVDAKDTKYFHVQVTRKQCQEMLERLAKIVRAVEAGIPPKREPDKCLFCSYKTVCKGEG
jgi:CRISPR/Cas system-associated exonuclease Cas4 (RecB family)